MKNIAAARLILIWLLLWFQVYCFIIHLDFSENKDTLYTVCKLQMLQNFHTVISSTMFEQFLGLLMTVEINVIN